MSQRCRFSFKYLKLQQFQKLPKVTQTHFYEEMKFRINKKQTNKTISQYWLTFLLSYKKKQTRMIRIPNLKGATD